MSDEEALAAAALLEVAAATAPVFHLSPLNPPSASATPAETAAAQVSAAAASGTVTGAGAASRAGAAAEAGAVSAAGGVAEMVAFLAAVGGLLRGGARRLPPAALARLVSLALHPALFHAPPQKPALESAEPAAHASAAAAPVASAAVAETAGATTAPTEPAPAGFAALRSMVLTRILPTTLSQGGARLALAAAAQLASQVLAPRSSEETLTSLAPLLTHLLSMGVASEVPPSSVAAAAAARMDPAVSLPPRVALAAAVTRVAASGTDPRFTCALVSRLLAVVRGGAVGCDDYLWLAGREAGQVRAQHYICSYGITVVGICISNVPYWSCMHILVAGPGANWDAHSLMYAM